ncbi:TonB-dependent receptor [Proteiniphilum sp. X52]|uniref:SusC/RagA family TonB-linked outer membrane protein n=1 Tax=Proteiniphilum sp. X52 TaxID=2382159 RepID=UPI000F0A1AD1|nr:TonB-dependent receptor [Proteiniphilum sp. X52]RNC66284.1 TonB-dependent receptor [Proteiniphilum sp. X52]
MKNILKHLRKAGIFSLFLLSYTISLYAQDITVNGTVTDVQNEPLIGVTVLVKGTTNGTITGPDGDFQLTNVPSNAQLEFSYVGMKSQTVAVNGQTTINVTLLDDSELLEEVVVTGYGGSQRRGTLTTAISKVDNAVLENAAFSNAGQSLQGTVTGLRVVNKTGQPGSEPDITLRGGATITGDNSRALIVVDGIIRNSLNDINTSDIESIQVLKDAAATAIYGSRANGGVILVETKRGKQGVTSVDYKFKTGVNFARKGYDFLNAEDYIYYNRIGYKRTGRTGIDTQQGYGVGNNLFDIRYLSPDTKHLLEEGWQSMKDPYDESKTILFKDHAGELDKEVFNNSALTQDHYLSLTGGNEKGTFVASLGYYNEDGQIIGTGYERYNGNLTGTYQILPFLNVQAGTTYSWSQRPELWIGTFEMFYRTRSQRPTWSPWLEDGSPASGFGTGDGNPAYYRDKLTSENSTRRTTYDLGFRIDILPEKLVLNTKGSLLHYDYQREKFNKSYQTQTAGQPNNTRQAEALIEKYVQKQLSSTLSYTNSFAQKHNIDAMVGGELYMYDEFKLEAKTQNSPTDDIPTLNAGANRTYTTSNKTAYRIMSGFGRVNYNYEMKYLLSLVARYDGISRLKDNRWGFFPGISAGWNIMEEDFWRESKISNFISNFKPRVSYGVNGNVNGIGNFEIYGSYEQIDASNYAGSSAFYNKLLVNSALRWEQSQSFEVGLDIGFLNNRINFILDYYNRSTKDLLTKQALPGYTGFTEIMTNMGTLRNYGFEMEMRANILSSANGFNWNVTANLSTVANKITRLPYNGNEFNRVGGYQVWDESKGGLTWIGGRQEGGKLGDLVAYKQIRILRDWDDVKQYANNRIDNVASLYGPGKAAEYEGREGWKPIEPGDVLWEDRDGNDVIDGYDRRVIGNIFPNITGGFSSTLSYKNFSLYTRFDYALGHTIYNDLAARSLGQYQGSFNIIQEVKNTWSEDNPNADLPKFYYADQLSKKNITRSNNANTAANNNSSRFYEKGDYLALRELTLSYDLPKISIRNFDISNASVYVTGQNLYYFTGYTGVSPEPAVDTTYGRGIDNGRYPTPRTVLLGLSLTF